MTMMSPMTTFAPSSVQMTLEDSNKENLDSTAIMFESADAVLAHHPTTQSPSKTSTSPRCNKPNVACDISHVLKYLDQFRLSSSLASPGTFLCEGLTTATDQFATTTNKNTFTLPEHTLPPLVSTVWSLSNDSHDQAPPKNIFRGPITRDSLASIDLGRSLHSSDAVMSHPLQDDSFLKDLDFTHLLDSVIVEPANNEDDKNKAVASLQRLTEIQTKAEQLLEQIKEERRATHEWVQQVRASVDEWVQQQRTLLKMERSPQVDRLEKVIQQQAKTIQQLEARLFHPMSPQEQPLEDQDSFVADMRHQVSPSLPNQHQSQVHPHRTYRTLPNGGRLVQYRNGTEREYWSNGTVVTKYMNGDVKTQAAEKVTYWHQKEQTTQTIQNNGVQVFEYPDRQIEKHYPDGSKEVTFPSGKIKKILPNKSPQHETS